jgi:hypothetical protein
LIVVLVSKGEKLLHPLRGIASSVDGNASIHEYFIPVMGASRVGLS